MSVAPPMYHRPLPGMRAALLSSHPPSSLPLHLAGELPFRAARRSLSVGAVIRAHPRGDTGEIVFRLARRFAPALDLPQLPLPELFWAHSAKWSYLGVPAPHASTGNRAEGATAPGGRAADNVALLDHPRSHGNAAPFGNSHDQQ